MNLKHRQGSKKLTCAKLALILCLTLALHAQDGLLSNYNYQVFTSSADGRGDLWVLAGDSREGLTRLTYNLSNNAQFSISGYHPLEFGDDYRGLWSIFPELTGEKRKVGLAVLQNDFFIPAFSTKYEEGAVRSTGLIIGNTRGDEATFYSLDLGEDLKRPRGLFQGASAKDSLLFFSAGEAGLVRAVVRSGSIRGSYDLHFYTPDSLQTWSLLESCSLGSACGLSDVIRDRQSNSDSLLQVFGVQYDSYRDSLWIATDHGLQRSDLNLSTRQSLGHSFLDTARITGIWSDPAGSGKLLIESGQRMGSRTKSSLWLLDTLSGVKPIRARTTSGNLSADRYDDLNLSITSAVFLNREIWLGVLRIGGQFNGLLKISSDTLAYQSSDAKPTDLAFAYGLSAGVTESDLPITAIARFYSGNRMLLAASTYGGGISVSADSAKTWISIQNRTPVSGGLSEVRTIPSVMRYQGTESVIAYRLNKNSKISIDVFSYDMEKVRSITQSKSRRADPVRSSVPSEDFWDGRDDAGRPVATGLYYIRVKSSDGAEAWGKIMNLVAY
jgi:hypothetical protein